jgi:hypothetical protein
LDHKDSGSIGHVTFIYANLNLLIIMIFYANCYCISILENSILKLILMQTMQTLSHQRLGPHRYWMTPKAWNSQILDDTKGWDLTGTG